MASTHGDDPDGVQTADIVRKRLNRAKPYSALNPTFVRIMPTAALVCALVLMALAATRAWEDAFRNAQADVRQLAAVGAEYGARTLDNLALIASRINDHIPELDALPAEQRQHRVHAELARLTAALRQPVIAFALDRDGFAIAASHMDPVPRDVSLADRDFFAALTQPDAPTTHVSRMFVGRFDNRLLIAVSQARRRQGPNGAAFDGMTTISVDPNHIGEGLRRLIGESGDSLALVRNDGEYIAINMPHDRPLPPEPPDSPLRRHLATGGASTTFQASSAAGDVLMAVHQVEGYPIHAAAARPIADVRADAFRSMAALLIFGVPATCALVYMALRVRREHLALQDANTALQLDVAQSSDRLERARRYALVGTFEVDLRSGASYRSPEYMDMHGRNPVATREVHADWVRRLHPDDREQAEARFLAAISDDSDVTDYAQTYRIVSADGDVRWIAARGVVERDDQGRAVLLRGIHADVTSLRTAEAALQDAGLRLRLTQDAVEIGNWEWSPRARHLMLGRKALEILGFNHDQPAPGWKDVLRRIHPSDRRMVVRGIRSASPKEVLRLEFRVPVAREDNPQTRWVMARGRSLPPDGGRPAMILGIAYDITDRKRMEERAAILAREVEHRSKNLMALVLGMVRMTEAPNMEALRESLEGRLMALSQTINLLSRSHWAGASLAALAQKELAPYYPGDPPETYLSGPDIQLGPEAAQSASMALHELATNAAKYGAFSRDAGRVSLDWHLAQGELRLTWKERGGPAMTQAPELRGFGSVLIRTAIEGQLGGTVVKRWETDGLRCEITVPADVLTARD